MKTKNLRKKSKLGKLSLSLGALSLIGSGGLGATIACGSVSGVNQPTVVDTNALTLTHVRIFEDARQIVGLPVAPEHTWWEYSQDNQNWLTMNPTKDFHYGASISIRLTAAAGWVLSAPKQATFGVETSATSTLDTSGEPTPIFPNGFANAINSVGTLVSTGNDHALILADAPSGVQAFYDVNLTDSTTSPIILGTWQTTTNSFPSSFLHFQSATHLWLVGLSDKQGTVGWQFRSVTKNHGGTLGPLVAPATTFGWEELLTALGSKDVASEVRISFVDSTHFLVTNPTTATLFAFGADGSTFTAVQTMPGDFARALVTTVTNHLVTLGGTSTRTLRSFVYDSQPVSSTNYLVATGDTVAIADFTPLFLVGTGINNIILGGPTTNENPLGAIKQFALTVIGVIPLEASWEHIPQTSFSSSTTTGFAFDSPNFWLTSQAATLLSPDVLVIPTNSGLFQAQLGAGGKLTQATLLFPEIRVPNAIIATSTHLVVGQASVKTPVSLQIATTPNV